MHNLFISINIYNNVADQENKKENAKPDEPKKYIKNKLEESKMVVNNMLCFRLSLALPNLFINIPMGRIFT
ncbi:hypothetical protein [Vibrio splendidus]|uniref:hypothetical protein n=1 Tax=Vibrio splendidus TaxID=29497 RepID=UPI0018E44494|nr:hypothetical protein [Vibrio splendidus]